MIKNFILKHFTYKLFAKTIIWTKYIKIFCDGGQPIFRYYPKFVNHYFDKYWNMKGFNIYIFGREINFIFGEDINSLYN